MQDGAEETGKMLRRLPEEETGRSRAPVAERDTSGGSAAARQALE